MLATHNSVVRARIDGKIKIEAEAVLASIGLQPLTLSACL